MRIFGGPMAAQRARSQQPQVFRGNASGSAVPQAPQVFRGSASPYANPWTSKPPPPPPPKVAPAPPPPPMLPVQAGTCVPRSVDEAWEFFGITKKRAKEEQVKKAYRKFAKQWHPDRNPDRPEEAKFQILCANAAWELLRRHCHW
jgi:hypothetical protein